LLLERQAHNPDVAPATRDLQLLREAAVLLRDKSAIAALDQQLYVRREEEQQSLNSELGLDVIDAPEAIPALEAPLLAQAEEPTVAAEVLAALREHFGFDSLRAGQATVIAQALQGEHVLGVLPTGAGKSLTYQLPALLLDGATLVISPLIALMKDQLDNLPPSLAACATTINSSLESSEVAARLRGIAEARYRLIFVAPERLRQQPFVQALRRVGVARVVVDEAHCVSLWGMSFRPDYLFIRRALDELGNPPVLALTATATPETESEIKTHLGDLTTVRTSVFRPNLRFEVTHVANKQEKQTAVVDLCREIAGPIVVYVRSREGCEEVAYYLRKAGVAAEHYHAQIADRPAVQDRFMRGETRVLVATVAFGMGVDKADVRAIVHYNLPPSVEAYYQEAGRAGRDGQPSRCVLLYAPTDKGQLTSWLREEAISKDYLRDVYRWLRRQISGTWGIVSLDELRHALREHDETRMRVALGLLERVGLLERHFDLPRSATLTLRDGLFGDDEFQALTQAAGLVQGVPVDVDLIALAEQLHYAPDALERRVLSWHSQGLLRYGGSGRDVLLEMRAAGADVGAQLDALLAEYANRQNERVEAIATYARSARCRHRAIAEHFGERMAGCGSACDICAPTNHHRAAADPRLSSQGGRGAATRYAEADVIRATLAAVGELSGRLNEKELVCLLLGMPGYPSCAAFGQLAGADFVATRAVVSSLIAAGRLAYRSRALVLASTTPRPAGPLFVQEAILRCIAHLPFAVGRSGLAKVLKGAAGSPIGPDRCTDYAALAHMTGSAIEAAIDHLIDQGYLRRGDGPRPLLVLSEQGAEVVNAEVAFRDA
jgi:ATP-dependent DNA helicase RecQ